MRARLGHSFPVVLLCLVTCQLAGCKKESAPPAPTEAPPAQPAAPAKTPEVSVQDVLKLLPVAKPPVVFASLTPGEPLTAAQRAVLPCGAVAGATYRPAVRIDEGNPMAGSTPVAFVEEHGEVTRTRLMMLAAEDDSCLLEVDVERKGPGGPEISGKYTVNGKVSRVIKSGESELTQVTNWRESKAPLVDGLELFPTESFEKRDKAFMRGLLGRVFGGESGAVALRSVGQEGGKWVRGGCGPTDAVTLYLDPDAKNDLHKGNEQRFPALERSYQDTYDFEFSSIEVKKHGRELTIAYESFPNSLDKKGSLVAKRDPQLQLWILSDGEERLMPERAAMLLPESSAECADDSEG